jgi:hypothetical protein
MLSVNADSNIYIPALLTSEGPVIQARSTID